MCGEPTNLEIGVQSKGVLVVRIDVEGRAAHGATPWLGDNAILKAMDLYRRMLELPFAAAASELFERPSINIGRIPGGDVVNNVPDHCRLDVDIRYLRIRTRTTCWRSSARWEPSLDPPLYELPPATSTPASRTSRAARGGAGAGGREAPAVGRDGASDAVFFLRRGIPASSSVRPAAATTDPRSTSTSSPWGGTGDPGRVRPTAPAASIKHGGEPTRRCRKRGSILPPGPPWGLPSGSYFRPPTRRRRTGIPDPTRTDHRLRRRRRRSRHPQPKRSGRAGSGSPLDGVAAGIVLVGRRRRGWWAAQPGRRGRQHQQGRGRAQNEPAAAAERAERAGRRSRW